MNKVKDYTDLTPVQLIDGIYFKRDDFFTYHNVNGGKVRSALMLTKDAKLGLVTAGSRKSPQIQIISEIAKYKKLPFIAYAPMGKLTKELLYAQNNGAIINQVPMGFNKNLIKKAITKAREINYTYIPFGMDSDEVLEGIANQVQNIPKECKRIVVTVGSGITLSGILRGLLKYNIDKSVLGVVVGADPKERLDKYVSTNLFNSIFSTGIDWRNMCTLVKSDKDYHYEVRDVNFCGIELDSIYEAKCIPYIEKDDLFWIIGRGIRS